MQKKEPTFLTRILGVKNNQQRWSLMKNLFYNELDANYVEAIDSLIDGLNSKATKEQQA
jgi:membrane-anchored protein YejM (alkaline phosphatase superfamily)